MEFRFSIITVITIYATFSLAIAQDLPRNERNPDGVLINQDYFVVQQYPEMKALLANVERNHLNPQVIKDVFAGVIYGINNLFYVLDKFANHPKALMLLGVGARIRNTPSLPIVYYDKALRLYPQYALTYSQYGNYLVDIGQIEQGIQQLRRAIALDGRLQSAYEGLSKAYNRIGDPKLAAESAEKARELRGKTTQ